MEPVAERMSLVDQVHARLVDAVCSGDLPPGTPLRQEWLAEELNVSRQPIIQALSMLKRDGLIEPAGKRGFQVTAVDAKTTRHVYDLRAAFDGLAASLAASQPEMIRSQALDKELNAGQLALQAEDMTRLVQADIAFHQSIYELSGNPMLPEASAAVWRQIRRVMRAVLENRTARASVWEEHAGIADAIRQGNAALAETRAVHHARDAADQLIGWMIEKN
ncbi:MAG: GntR family transcriptional regulator [Alphaproteobacteria bacterium]|nr:GntR family transcriptional regulator [Alphaproteobacteria bacterium]